MKLVTKTLWVAGFLALGLVSESHAAMLMPVSQTTTRISVSQQGVVNPVGVGVGAQPLPGQPIAGQPLPGQPIAGQPMPGGPMMGNHGMPCGGPMMRGYGGGCGRPNCGAFRGRPCGPRGCGGGCGIRFRRAMHCGGGRCGGGGFGISVGIRIGGGCGGFGRGRRC